MKIKTKDLIGEALDYAVAQLEKANPSKSTGEPFLYEHRLYLQDFMPSTMWSHGGPIIEREKIWWSRNDDAMSEQDVWYCLSNHQSLLEQISQTGPTLLVAAMRCFVASKLGDVVEIPNNLS